MNRFKIVALNALGIVFALALLGFFASVGLAAIGVVLFLLLIGLVTAQLTKGVSTDDAPRTKPERSA